MIFFNKTTAFTHTMYFSRIRERVWVKCGIAECGK